MAGGKNKKGSSKSIMPSSSSRNKSAPKKANKKRLKVPAKVAKKRQIKAAAAVKKDAVPNEGSGSEEDTSTSLHLDFGPSVSDDDAEKTKKDEPCPEPIPDPQPITSVEEKSAPHLRIDSNGDLQIVGEINKAQPENELSANADFIAFDVSEEEQGSEGQEDDEEEEGSGSERSNQSIVKGPHDVTLKDIAESLSIQNGVRLDFSNKNQSSSKYRAHTPWVEGKDYSQEREVCIRLHREILDFVEYVGPTQDDYIIRCEAVTRIRDCVIKTWPSAEAHVFGSFATGLYLPHADIDMVVISPRASYCNKSSLYILASRLKSQGITPSVEVIAKAKVPIIKFRDRVSGINVDISFEKPGGLIAANTIRHWLSTTPGLEELVLIVKHYLANRGLNNVAIGGLGGYAVICLVMSFLAMHPRLTTGQMSAKDNLGVLLIEFFELYGNNFNYEEVGIAMRNGIPSYFPKYMLPHLTNGGRFSSSSYSLVVQDPNDPDNNITRGSFNLWSIRKAFMGAYELITNECYDIAAEPWSKSKSYSILGSILNYSGNSRPKSSTTTKTQFAFAYDNKRRHHQQKTSESTFSSKRLKSTSSKSSSFPSMVIDVTGASSKNTTAIPKAAEPVQFISDDDDESSDHNDSIPEVINIDDSSSDSSSGVEEIVPEKKNKFNVLRVFDQSDDDDDDESETQQGTGSVEKKDQDTSFTKGKSKSSLDKQARRKYWASKAEILSSSTTSIEKEED